MDTLIESRDNVNKWMERFGVRFGVYKMVFLRNNCFLSIPFHVSSANKIGTNWKEGLFSV